VTECTGQKTLSRPIFQEKELEQTSLFIPYMRRNVTVYSLSVVSVGVGNNKVVFCAEHSDLGKQKSQMR